MGAMTGIRRGCGSRVEGGIYLETKRSPNGKPLEYFLVDPPIPYEPDHKLGMEMVERDGVFHLVDYVGHQHYPHAADFLEEVRLFGMSRRASRSVPLERLTPESRLVVVHARGYLENAEAYGKLMSVTDKAHPALSSFCRRWAMGGDDFHLRHTKQMCTRHLWVMAEPNVDEEGEALTGRWLRRNADTRYEVYPFTYVGAEGDDAGAAARWLGTLPKPVWRTAIVAMLPVSHVSVVKAEDGSHRATLKELLGRAPGYLSVDEADA